MKNRLIDLNNHLFAQLERLGDEQISAEDLAREVERSGAITTVAKELIAVGQLALKAQKAVATGAITKGLPLLELDKDAS